MRCCRQRPLQWDEIGGRAHLGSNELPKLRRNALIGMRAMLAIEILQGICNSEKTEWVVG